MGASRLLLTAGLLVWGLVGIRVLRAVPAADATAFIDLAAWIGFGLAFLAHVRAGKRRGIAVASLAVQTLAALKLGHAAGIGGMEVALLVMVAGQLPAQFGSRASFAWVLGQTSAAAALQTLALSSHDKGSALGVILYFGAYLSFQFFALGTASLAEAESRARIQLAHAKEEIERMHALALQNARQAERLRIARDLHDSLGHRLTALGLALEAARHLPVDGLAPKIAEARGLASALLDDLRASVGDLRDDETPELKSLLEGLAHGFPDLRVSIEIGDDVRLEGPDATAALFRISQEIATNAARHSRAKELRLSLRREGDEGVLEGTDDGAFPAAPPKPGNGLTGIRERARLLGGDATWFQSPAGGFGVRVRIPLDRLR